MQKSKKEKNLIQLSLISHSGRTKCNDPLKFDGAALTRRLEVRDLYTIRVNFGWHVLHDIANSVTMFFTQLWLSVIITERKVFDYIVLSVKVDKTKNFIGSFTII